MTEKSPMEAALAYLNRRAYTEHQLSERMASDGFNETEVKECLARLNTWGYLNDHQFGTDRIRLLLKRLKSRSYVKLDLANSGLEQKLIAELLDTFYPEKMESSVALEFIHKRPTSKRQKRKYEVTVLIRAGFSEDTILQCFPGIDPT